MSDRAFVFVCFLTVAGMFVALGAEAYFEHLVRLARIEASACAEGSQ